MITDNLEQIAVILVVTVIKESHVTRRRGLVLKGVTLDTREFIATKVRYMLASLWVLFQIKVK